MRSRIQPRRLLPAGFFVLCLLQPGCATRKGKAAAPERFTIRVEQVPAYTPSNATIFVAGNFNGWNPGDSAFRLKPDGKGNYIVALPASISGPIEFKFTLGSWDAVETDSSGNDISNRGVFVGTGHSPTYATRVAAWKDPAKARPRAHTARASVSIISESFEMPELGRARRVWIYLPPQYATGNDRYPVMYMHDGQNVFDDATSFVGEWGVDESLDSLSARGDKGAIVVAVDHGGSKRFDEYSPWRNEKYGGGEGDKYVDFLVKTLKPYIDSHYRTLADRSNTAIGGSSMGGLISLYAVMKYPDVFSRAAIFSPAFWVAPQYLELSKTTAFRPDVRLYFLIGAIEAANADEAASYVKHQQDVVDVLLSRGLVRDRNVVSIVRQDGKHSEWFWRREFPAAYSWLFGR